jgi:hypothetical protein
MVGQSHVEIKVRQSYVEAIYGIVITRTSCFGLHVLVEPFLHFLFFKRHDHLLCITTMTQATTNSEIEQVKMDVTCSSSETSTVCHGHSSKEGGKVREVRQPFPCKVYDMLQNVDSQDFWFIVSWNAKGSGFTIHDKDLFTSKIVLEVLHAGCVKYFLLMSLSRNT